MIVVVMGVSGSGKTSVGKKLANRFQCEFVDADDFHSADNKAKMHSGVPLTDEDRRPWLQSLARLISNHRQAGTGLVLACSALKKAYRDILAGEHDELSSHGDRTNGKTIFVYLKVDYKTLEKRLARRHHEFMNPTLLKSQFDTLEEPTDAIVVDSSQSLAATVKDIVAEIES